MATKLPSGNYRTQVLIDREKRKYKSFIGKTAREADMLAEQWKTQYLQNPETSLSFYNAAKNYLAASTKVLAPSTYRGYNNILKSMRKNHVVFSRKELRSISKEDLQRLFNAMIADGKSPKTVKNCNSFISIVFNYYDLQMPKAKLPEVRPSELNIPDEKTLSILLEDVKGTRLEIPIKLGMRGLRRGEVCAIKADDIEGNVLHIRRSLTLLKGKWIEKAPKTKVSNRFIPLPQDIADAIKEQGYATDMNPAELTMAFRREVRKESLNLKPFRFHDLRHAFVSIAHAHNIPDSYIMAMGGWNSNYTMNRVYRHTLNSYISEYQEQMENILGNI